MTIPPDLEAQILRYYHVEKWRVGTIARQLHVHHGTVARVLAQAGLPRIGPPARRSQVEPYLPFIHQTLEKFPTLTASRLYAMVCERGYRGSGDHFRHLIACHRPRPAAEAYLRLRSLPGEQGQVDWGHFGHLMIGRARAAFGPGPIEVAERLETSDMSGAQAALKASARALLLLPVDQRRKPARPRQLPPNAPAGHAG